MLTEPRAKEAVALLPAVRSPPLDWVTAARSRQLPLEHSPALWSQLTCWVVRVGSDSIGTLQPLLAV